MKMAESLEDSFLCFLVLSYHPVYPTRSGDWKAFVKGALPFGLLI